MKPRLALAGLAALLVVDVVLVVLSLQTGRPSADASSASSPPVATTRMSASPTSSVSTPDTPTPTTTTPAPTYRPAPLTVMIVAVNEQRAWRATIGRCKGDGGAVQTTTNGGATWVTVRSPASAIARIQPLAGQRGFAFAAGTDCVLKEYATNDGARSWQGPRPLDGAWARQVSDSRVVVTPQQPASRPCGDQAVIDLARTATTQAEALCLEGGITRTTNGGASWSDAGRAPGALSLATRGPGQNTVTYVARVVATCLGIEITEVPSDGTPPKRISCVASPGPADAGAVSLSTPSAAGWLAVGEQTWVAGADLAKWTKA